MSLPPPVIPDSKAAEEMYRALGKALTRWQYIETGLYLIAHCLMETEHQVSSLAFFQIKSAENKLAFVDRLIFAKLTQHTRTKFLGANPQRREDRHRVPQPLSPF
jgi:hypothetical protein